MTRITSLLFLLLVIGVVRPGWSQAAGQPAAAPRPAGTPSQEMLAQWNSIGNRLIAMAEDMAEDKYGFKAQKDQRSFGENLVHVAEEDYRLLSAIKGAPMGPAGRKDLNAADFKNKADVVKLIKQAVADGAALPKEHGHDGLSREIKYPYGNRIVHAAYAWVDAVEHSGEHYGQLVVYYRVLGLVPPASRPRPR